MGKLKNMIIEMEEMNLTADPFPWDMGAPLCKRCDSSNQEVITKNDKTMIVSCSYCDKAIQVLDTSNES